MCQVVLDISRVFLSVLCVIGIIIGIIVIIIIHFIT